MAGSRSSRGQRQRQHAQHDDADGAGTDLKPASRQHGREAAAKALNDLAEHGKGKPTDVARLLTELDYEPQGKELLPKLARHLSGDLVLASSEVVSAPVEATALAAASKVGPTSASLERYLRRRTVSELATLTADDVQRLRSILNKSLGHALPQLANLPLGIHGIHGHRALMSWYIELTDPVIAGMALAANRSCLHAP